MNVTMSDIRSVDRPVHSLWSKVALEPLTVRLAAVIASKTNISSLTLTYISFLLAIVSAGLFLVAEPAALVSAALIYQASTLADGLDGAVARAKPGAGSLAGVALDHALDPVRLVMALAYGQYVLLDNPLPLLLATAFVAVHFSDWTQPRTIHKLRRAYRSLYEPRLTPTDEVAIAVKNRFERHGMRVIFFSIHERELCVLLIGPMLGIVESMLVAGTLLAMLFFVLRLRFDVALLKNTLVNQTTEYLGDTENKWETGLANQ